jgi:hypothetical protein
MTEADERALLRHLGRFELDVYPKRVPPDWKAFRATEEALPNLPTELYLAASALGPVLVDKVKRGPDKGSWRVDEVRSPVVFWQRCSLNDDGELMSGQLWAELTVTPQTGRRDAASDRFRALYLEIESWLKKTFRRGIPREYLIGPDAARKHKDGLAFRVDEHDGDLVRL